MEGTLKLLAKLGPNGLLILGAWVCCLVFAMIEKIPSQADSLVEHYKIVLMIVVATAATIFLGMVVTWNLLGRPKRLGG